jgi:4'-phosphopantetheinyl transferase
MNGIGTSARTGLVDVWLIDVAAAGDLGGARLLDDGDRAVLHRLRVEDDRRSYLVAHVLLRLALSRMAKGRVPPAGWRFDRSAWGRPSVASASGAPKLDFSLTRSSGLAAVAVANAEGCRVGIDAERRDRPLCCIPADVVLSPAERSQLATFPPCRQASEFLKLWTLKEAYGKLRGRGICFPLERVEIAVSPERLVRTEDGLDTPEDLHLESRRVRTATGVYHTSLAVRCPPGVRPRASFRVLDTVWPNPGEDPQLPADEGAVEHGRDEEAR